MAEDLYAEVFDIGGTISGEHGDGISRTPFVRRQYGPLGSGCFLALGVLDADRYFLYTVTDDAKPGVALHSA